MTGKKLNTEKSTQMTQIKQIPTDMKYNSANQFYQSHQCSKISLKKYFWDCNFEDLTLEKHPEFIIERILNFGTEEEIEWLKKNVNKEKFKIIALSSRRLDRKTANYWKRHYMYFLL